jgi:hypothetical protein
VARRAAGGSIPYSYVPWALGNHSNGKSIGQFPISDSLSERIVDFD